MIIVAIVIIIIITVIIMQSESVPTRSREFFIFVDGIGTRIGKIWYQKSL